MRVCRVSAAAWTFTTLLRTQVRELAEAGIDLTLVASPEPAFEQLARELPQVRCVPLPMVRAPSPARDLRSLRRMIRLLRAERFDIVHSTGPKGGLLAALAARAAGVPLRLHTFTGQVWVGLREPIRWITRQTDRVVGGLNTHLYADSHSQREFLITEGLAPPAKIQVLGAGSVSGVDLRRFDVGRKAEVGAALRRILGIPASAVVIAFVGRLTRDKGAGELVTAFGELARLPTETHLLLVGPQEPHRDPLLPATLAAIESHPRIHAVGFQPHPEQYLAAADIFCLPSYREGFGSAAIEAGALGLPTVGTRIVGLTDAVIDGQTGLLVPAKDAGALAAALGRLIESPALRARLGAGALARVRDHFDGRLVSRLLIEEYARLARRSIGKSADEACADERRAA